MDIIFIAGVIQSLFFALLIGSKKTKTYADKVLIFWLITIGVHLLYFTYEYNQWYYNFPHIYGLGSYIPTLHGPLLFLYFKALISKKSKPVWKDILHFLPFIFANLLIIDLLLQSGAEKLHWLNTVKNFPLSIHIGGFMNNIVGPIYIIIVLYLSKKHQVRIKNIFSYTENVSLQWIKNITYGLGIIWVVVFLSSISHYLLDSSFHQRGSVFIYITVVFFVFSIGYFGFKQTSLFTDYTGAMPLPVPEAKTTDRYAKSGLNDKESEGIKNLLQTYIHDHKPYLEGTLSLDQLASKLQVNRHQLSQVINEKIGLSFFDLVNKYRVEEFKNRIQKGDADKFTLLGIAFDCGFNSKASFNRIFKNQTGMTPSVYLTLENSSQPAG